MRPLKTQAINKHRWNRMCKASHASVSAKHFVDLAIWSSCWKWEDQHLLLCISTHHCALKLVAKKWARNNGVDVKTLLWNTIKALRHIPEIGLLSLGSQGRYFLNSRAKIWKPKEVHKVSLQVHRGAVLALGSTEVNPDFYSLPNEPTAVKLAWEITGAWLQNLYHLTPYPQGVMLLGEISGHLGV